MPLWPLLWRVSTAHFSPFPATVTPPFLSRALKNVIRGDSSSLVLLFCCIMSSPSDSLITLPSFHLVGFTKPVRNQRDLSVKHHIEVFRCVYLAFREFQSVEHRLERLFDDSRDGAASSSGIQSQSVLGGLQRCVFFIHLCCSS
ncbi:hypothetical protein DEO72_LG5g2249 [Vigna unguiculata]|uniref:Uncharacterized protein n=1 Tax=Vigna unguiculata TaxID=3917 RepID=A0A4D6LYX6_VIGUN|nr:hypothetical protein DEO72_LG5g2249 [Vigna unguiculata]